MPTAKDVLNELKWREDRDFSQVEITYIHRGAPNDVMVIPGTDIKSLGRSFFETEEASIPYHRIVEIRYGNDVIWLRKEESKSGRE